MLKPYHVGTRVASPLWEKSLRPATVRGGHRGHMSEATRSLEAGSSFPVQKKESASDTRRLFFYTPGNCSRLRVSTAANAKICTSPVINIKYAQ
ncbi:MAG: hypothetical protein FWF77_05950 [Defluviitaleaceae bacterium]|nr:hypothetical protein [Defluviitaleaceae bacterium]